MTRATKRDVDRGELRGIWERQAADLGLDTGGRWSPGAREASAVPERDRGPEPASEVGMVRETAISRPSPGARSVAFRDPGGNRAAGLAGGAGRPGAGAPVAPPTPWSGRWSICRNARPCLRAPISWPPPSRTRRASTASATSSGKWPAREQAGALHAVSLPGAEDSLATDRTVGEERETIALMRAGEARGQAPMRGWAVQGHLNRGPLTAGQKEAVKLILSARDRVVGVQGYAGTGKTTMLDRARVLAGKKGWRMVGLAPSASAVQTLAAEAGIGSETLQRFLARHAGVAEGRLTRKGAREMRAAFAKTILVVDEGLARVHGAGRATCSGLRPNSGFRAW